MSHPFAPLTLLFACFCAYSVPGSCPEGAQRIQESHPRQVADSKAPGKRWRPGRGRGSAERTWELPRQANVADSTACSLSPNTESTRTTPYAPRISLVETLVIKTTSLPLSNSANGKLRPIACGSRVACGISNIQ